MRTSLRLALLPLLAAAFLLPRRAVGSDDLGGVDFTLKPGMHRAEGPGVGVVSPSGQRDRTLRFKVRFDASCRYRTKDPRNQADWNKVMGISTAQIHHTSLRLGWRYAPARDRIEVGLYAYVQGKRISQRVASVRIGAWAPVELCIKPAGLRVVVGKTRIERPVDLGPTGPLTALTFVLRTCYFGGDETAPQPMKVAVKDVSVESR